MFRRRVDILLLVLVLVAAVLTARLAQLQLLSDLEPDSGAASGSFLETVRGGIYTREGVPLAQDGPAFHVAVRYPRLKDSALKEQLSRFCGLPVEEVQSRAEDIILTVERMKAAVARKRQEKGLPEVEEIIEERQYHALLKDVPRAVAAAIEAGPQEFEDVKVLPRSVRSYPDGSLAPHIVGRTRTMTEPAWNRLQEPRLAWRWFDSVKDIGSRYLMSDDIGEGGIEEAYELLLRGRRGWAQKELVFKTLTVETETTSEPPEPGLDVYLTLRADFQRAANDALESAAKQPELQFSTGALVIVDVRDGGVLAAATYPSYDLATFTRDYEALERDEREPLRFRPTQAVLPTGSVYKVITAIAALEEGKIDAATAFDCHRYETYYGRRFQCTSSHGRMTLVPAIEQSCNIYFYETARLVGPEALAEWGRRFGLDRPTGIDLQNWDHRSIIPVPRPGIATLNLAIGGGNMQCTPLQVACMMAAVANGGKLFRPHFLHHAETEDGETVQTYEPKFETIPISEETLRVVREGMRRAVQSGTARDAELDPFKAAGKTGTAEVTETINHAWFAGFAPYENPRIAFAVVSERTAGHGGRCAAPILTPVLERVWPQVEEMP